MCLLIRLEVVCLGADVARDFDEHLLEGPALCCVVEVLWWVLWHRRAWSVGGRRHRVHLAAGAAETGPSDASTGAREADLTGGVSDGSSAEQRRRERREGTATHMLATPQSMMRSLPLLAST